METKKLTGIELIAQERQEQIEKHGWTLDHDDNVNDRGQLALAAEAIVSGESDEFPYGWDKVSVKKMCDKSILQRLIISGAFYRAEIERLERRMNKIAAEIDYLQEIKSETIV